MFKIIKYRNNSGKILMTIETDDQAAADFWRFFGAVNKFVDLFHYRMRSAKSFDLYQKTDPHKLALLDQESLNVIVERFFALIRFYMVFILLAPALALHWTLKRLKQ